MYLTRHQTSSGPRWAVDNKLLPPAITLSVLLSVPRSAMAALLSSGAGSEQASTPLLPPIDAQQEVWAAGVTYLRSRDARQAESKTADVYQRVYDAERPEVFFKAAGWRVQGHGMTIHVRTDSHWNVPEPEMVIVANALGEIVGYTAGNDMSSRDIEGENPLYLPQAKVYRGSCALGPALILAESVAEPRDLEIRLAVLRDRKPCFEGATGIGQMKRTFEDLISYLCREQDFPQGVILLTGTGVVPPDSFTLRHGDLIEITVPEIGVLRNTVE